MSRQVSADSLGNAVSFEPLVAETYLGCVRISTKRCLYRKSSGDESLCMEKSNCMHRNGRFKSERNPLVACEWSISMGQRIRLSIHGSFRIARIICQFSLQNLSRLGPRFASPFVDIQVPVIRSRSMLDDVSLLTNGIASRYLELACSEAPPVWATESSQGHFTYARNLP